MNFKNNFILFILLVIKLTLFGQTIPECKSDIENTRISTNDDKGILSSRKCNYISFGADVTNGSVVLFETDISWFIFEGEIEFTRILNTNLNKTSGFGKKWSHNFDINLEYITESIFILNKPAEKKLTFQRSKRSDIYLCEDNFDTLRVTGDGTFIIKTFNRQTLEFNSFGKLAKITDSDKNTTYLLYNKNRQIQVIVDPTGRELYFMYYTNGLISSVVSPDKRILKYIYDENGYLATVKFQDGTSRNYLYDNEGRLSSFKDINTGVFIFKYSNKGNIRSISDPMGNTGYFDYKNKHNVCIYTDPDENKWTYYSRDNNIVKIISPEDIKTSYDWNKKGQLTKQINSEGIISDYIYVDNILTQIRRSDGNTTTFLHDEKGNMIHYKSAHDDIKLTYNDEHQIITRENVKDKVSEYYIRNLWGLISELKIGEITYNAFYDTAGNILKIRSPHGMETFKYDVMGNMTSYSDSLNNIFTATYDEMNRIKNISYSEKEIFNFTYDIQGNLIKISGPGKKSKTFVFDKLNRLSEINSGTTSYLYYEKSGKPVEWIDNTIETANQVISGQLNLAGIRFSLARHHLYTIAEQIKSGNSRIIIPVRNKKRITRNNIDDDWFIYFDIY